jgi:hypothetical protein
MRPAHLCRGNGRGQDPVQRPDCRPLARWVADTLATSPDLPIRPADPRPQRRPERRHRLGAVAVAALIAEIAAYHAAHDIGRARHLDDLRTALVTELRRASGLGGRSRSLGASTTERARKTVSSRLREAIRRIHAVDPELGAHLDRSIITGTTCRYQPTTPLIWKLEARDE